MDELKMLKQEERDWNTAYAVRTLQPEIRAAAAEIKKRRQERLQLLAFLAVALAFLGAAACVVLDFRAYGRLTGLSRNILTTLGTGAGLSLLLAPVLAYFAEEENNYESA